MRIALLLGSQGGPLTVIFGPSNPAEVTRAYKLALQSEKFSEIQLWTSDCGIQKKKKFGEFQPSDTLESDSAENFGAANQRIAQLEKLLTEERDNNVNLRQSLLLAESRTSNTTTEVDSPEPTSQTEDIEALKEPASADVPAEQGETRPRRSR